MGMVPLDLSSLARGQVARRFEVELERVRLALMDPALEETASITIKVDFRRREVEGGGGVSPFLDVSAKIATKLPSLKAGGVVMVQDDMILTETVVDDAKQPGLELRFVPETGEVVENGEG